MSDERVAEIREALKWYDYHGPSRIRQFRPLVEAARAYADLLDKGEWMHSHDNLTGEDRRWFQTTPEPSEPWLHEH